MAMRPLKVSINRSLIDKEEPRNKLAYSHDWEAFELSIEDLGAAVQKGWAYGPRWNGIRKGENFCCSDIAVVDIDNAPSLDEILSREPIREHAALVHTTSSHTAEHARARAIFVLPETILRGDEFAAINLSLALRCGGDLSPTSAATGFFGFREADVRIAHRELPAELVRELIAQSLPAIKTRRSNGAATVRSGLSVTADQQVKCADGRLVHVSDLNPRVPLHCPYHDDRHASAFTVQNRHGVTGIHCSTCQTTYWPERSETAYDFNDFEAHVVRARDYFERHRDWGPLLSDPDHVIEGLTDCSVSIVDRFATPNELAPGVTLIRAPKGTGKTRGLADLISRAPSVLLIGHRRTLIRHTCERLGLEVYLDHEGSLTGLPRLGICLDSLARIPASERYRIVVLDESEQVLAHLPSDTVEGPGKPGRDRLFIELSHRVQSAERTVALDADMSWITFDTLLRMQTRLTRASNKAVLPPVRIWINQQKIRAGQPPILLFESQQHLVSELEVAVDEGQKCFVTSNSKTLVERLAAALAHRFGSGRRVLLITSNTVSSEEVQGFISDPASRIRDYDVVLTSPSLGTGVDISLADNSKLVDVVFGFFEPHTNHFEIDQQLARVRDPGAIKVWITARRWNYETEFEIVREDIMRQSLFKNVLMGYTAEGAPQYDATDPFINMAALIVSRDRASKNNLRKHFVEHKRQQGYEVQSVSKDEDRSAIGTDLLREGKQLFDQRLKEGLLRAAPMRKPDFEEVREALEGNDGVEGDDRWAYERTQLELFYRASATAALIEADRRGRYRKEIKLFEGITELQHRYGNGPPDLRPGSRVVKRGEESALAMLHLLQRSSIYRDGQFLISVIYGASVRPVVLTGADLGHFVRFCRDHKASIETLLGCEVRSDVETKPVQQLGAVLKLVGLRLKAAGSKKRSGMKTYSYQVEARSCGRLTKVVEARRQTKAWESLYQRQVWDPEELSQEEES